MKQAVCWGWHCKSIRLRPWTLVEIRRLEPWRFFQRLCVRRINYDRRWEMKVAVGVRRAH